MTRIRNRQLTVLLRRTGVQRRWDRFDHCECGAAYGILILAIASSLLVIVGLIAWQMIARRRQTRLLLQQSIASVCGALPTAQSTGRTAAC